MTRCSSNEVGQYVITEVSRAILVILTSLSPVLAVAGGVTGVLVVAAYVAFHRRFYDLNHGLNQQSEQQVSILERRKLRPTLAHLLRLRRLEVRLSDTEAALYGAEFIVLLGMILFNLWFAATALVVTVGTIFAIISYSWEFIESSLALPLTLQNWSRLSEIMRRLNTQTGPADTWVNSVTRPGGESVARRAPGLICCSAPCPGDCPGKTGSSWLRPV